VLVWGGIFHFFELPKTQIQHSPIGGIGGGSELLLSKEETPQINRDISKTERLEL